MKITERQLLVLWEMFKSQINVCNGLFTVEQKYQLYNDIINQQSNEFINTTSSNEKCNWCGYYYNKLCSKCFIIITKENHAHFTDLCSVCFNKSIEKTKSNLDNKNDDSKFLSWMSDRLINVYKESPNIDFVLRLKEISNKLKT